MERFNEFRAYLAVSLYNLGVAEQDIDDLINDTFLLAWDARNQHGCYEGWTDSRLRGWLVQIARNHCRNTARRETRRAVAQQKNAVETARRFAERAGIAEITERNEETARLNATIDELPVLEQQVVRRRMEGRTYQQIAHSLGRTQHEVRTAMELAMRHLRQSAA